MSMDEVKKLEDESLDTVAGGLLSNETIAYQVLEGYWGNGDERIQRLSRAGYNPYAVQNIVNRLVREGYEDPYKRPRQDPYKPSSPYPPSYVDPYK